MKARPSATGAAMHALIARLFPLNRSLTGHGVRETLRVLRESIPLEVHEVPSGTPAFDWTVPDEWNVRDAWVKDPKGRVIIDFKKSNLHLLGYSAPFRGKLPLAELKKHLYTLPKYPAVTPYVTSYYERRWGFCLPHRELKKLKNGTYEAFIDADLAPGSMTYADLVIPGRSDEEILISTYVCHPSMANNELSGPAVATFLAKRLLEGPARRYTYRFVFAPETIGAIVYLSRHLGHLKAKTVAGFVLTSIGDSGALTYLSSRTGDRLNDRAARHALKTSGVKHAFMDFRVRGSQERQYCPAGGDLPVGCLMRTRPGDHPEYHTSADDLDFVKPAKLEEALETVWTILASLEANRTCRSKVLCEPNLGKRGLYSTITNNQYPGRGVMDLLDVLAWSDGRTDLLAIAEHLGQPMAGIASAADRLEKEGLLETV